jgi:hypothetical protein
MVAVTIFDDRLTRTFLAYSIPTGKGKAVPLQAWSGPEGSRKLRFPDYKTTAEDGRLYPQEIILLNLSF